MGGGYFEFILSVALINETRRRKENNYRNYLCVFNDPAHNKKFSLNKTSNFHFENLIKEFLRGTSTTS